MIKESKRRRNRKTRSKMNERKRTRGSEMEGGGGQEVKTTIPPLLQPPLPHSVLDPLHFNSGW